MFLIRDSSLDYLGLLDCRHILVHGHVTLWCRHLALGVSSVDEDQTKGHKTLIVRLTMEAHKWGLQRQAEHSLFDAFKLAVTLPIIVREMDSLFTLVQDNITDTAHILVGENADLVGLVAPKVLFLRGPLVGFGADRGKLEVVSSVLEVELEASQL